MNTMRPKEVIKSAKSGRNTFNVVDKCSRPNHNPNPRLRTVQVCVSHSSDWLLNRHR